MVDRTYRPFSYDDDLIEVTRRDGRTRVRVYRLTDTVAVLGSGSRPEVELDLGACERENVPILRRRGGGCAVVLDPGNVIVSVAATGIPFGGNRRQFDTLTAWLIDGLARIGVSGVEQAGICDLAVEERKVGGACLRRSRDLLYYSASLVIDPDMDKVTRYLKHPPREPEYRRGRNHRDFMGLLAAHPGIETLRGTGPLGPNARRFPGTANGDCAGLVVERLRLALGPPDLQHSPGAFVPGATNQADG